MLVEMFESAEQVCDDLFNVADLIYQKFSDKGYSAVNLVWEKIDGEYCFGLEFCETEYCRFVKNMRELGYTCNVYPAHKKRYRWITVDGYNPIELLNVYHYLEKIGNG